MKNSDLSIELEQAPIPKHIAIIMDGNGRWAKRRGLVRLAGHRAGVLVIKEILKTVKEIGIQYLTVFAFSTENWKRPEDEVSGLMDLLVEFLDKELDYLHSEGVRIHPIGCLEKLPERVRERLEKAVLLTKDNSDVVFNVALNYGGRQEIIQGIKVLCEEYKDGKISLDQITETVVSNQLYTANQPDPDLVIRSSGEMRISNFLLWQIAYAEIWFTDVLWPDFGREELLKAICDFQKRDRRYGGLTQKEGK